MKKNTKIKIPMKAWHFLVCLVAVIIVGVVYSISVGAFAPKEIDLRCLEDDNPVRREINVESYNTATVVVAHFDKYNKHYVHVIFEEAPNIIASVYLSEHDIAKLNIGNIITVRGHVNYTNLDSGREDDVYKHRISIGNSIDAFPMFSYATLVSIEKGTA